MKRSIYFYYKGGSWFCREGFCHIQHQNKDLPDYPTSINGFRIKYN